MTLADILKQQRALYTEEFGRRVSGFAADIAQVLQPEALYRGMDGDPVRTGSLSLLARGDICVTRDGRVVEIARIESPRALGFEPFQFVWSDAMQVALHPFAWDECLLCVPEPKVGINCSVISSWFEESIKLSLPQADIDSPACVVHCISDPREAADGVRLEIDFGSAPVAVFESLLSALASAGVGLVVIGRAPMQEPGEN